MEADLLLTHGLLDELRLWVHPFMLGAGGVGDLLFRLDRVVQFELARAPRRCPQGNVVLTYRVAWSTRPAGEECATGVGHALLGRREPQRPAQLLA